MVNDYNRSPQEVLEELHTSPLGLTAAEITAGVAAYVPTGSRMRGRQRRGWQRTAPTS